MAETYKHSYKSGEILMTSLSVYNTGYQMCEAGYQWGPGVRDHYCIHHILSGAGYYTVGEKTWKLEAGDTFILYPGVEVKYYADQQEPWEYAWAGFMGTDAASIIRNTGFLKERPFLKRGNVPDDQIRNGLEQIYNAKSNGYEEAVAMTGALYSLLSVFMHYHEGEEQERDAKLLYVEKAENYIETNYSYPVTVEDIADYVGISRSYLFRSFQTYMNCSPKEYLTEYRIRQACRLLKETGLSVSAIAYSVGFENNLYFSKAFRKVKKTSQKVSDEVKPVVALTFDDGPNASSTPILLDGLKERKVRATFFLIGENVEKDENEKIVKRMYEEGHLIGNHTYTHCNLSKLETGEAKKELEQTDTVIEKITGKQPVFARAPYGELPVDSEQDLSRIYIGWTVDPLDWMTEDTGAVVKTVVEEINPGDVILLHDCYPSSVQAAIRIVDLLQGKGYEFVTVDHLIMD